MACGQSGRPGLHAHEAVRVESPIERGNATTPGIRYTRSQTNNYNGVTVNSAFLFIVHFSAFTKQM